MSGLPVDLTHPAIDPDRAARASAILDGGARDGVFPGAVGALAVNGSIVYIHAAGRQQDAPEPRDAMPVDAIFDLASVTKPIVGTALMLCIEDGLLGLDDRVSKFVPEFAAGEKAAVRIRHIVSHTSGVQSNPKLYHEHKNWETLLPAYLALPLVGAPGSLFLYSSINLIILQQIIERASEKTLDVLLAERVFGPLGMKDTGYTPSATVRDRIPATEYVGWRDSYDWGVVNDKTAQMAGGVAGHAGLFSTAADLLLYGTMLLNGGTLNGVRVMSPLAARLFTSPWTDERGIRRGICWLPGNPRVFGDLLGPVSMCHTGTTGTAICIAPSEGVVAVLLTNRVHPTRDNARIEGFRPRFFNAIASALTARKEN